MSRTNIDIDDALIEEALRLTGASTKKEDVDIALRRRAGAVSRHRLAGDSLRAARRTVVGLRLAVAAGPAYPRYRVSTSRAQEEHP